jgi:hypothetical protein
VESWDPSFTAGYSEFRLDDKKSASVLNLGALLTRLMGQHVGIVSVSSQVVDYENNAAASGTTYEAGYRHWFLLEDSNINRRIEASLRGGTTRCQSSKEDYWTIAPAIGATYRFTGGAKPAFGTVDGGLRGSWERRNYSDPLPNGDDHRYGLLTTNISLDYWLDEVFSVGLYGTFSKRDSTDTSEDYDRIQTGLRLAGAW